MSPDDQFAAIVTELLVAANEAGLSDDHAEDIFYSLTECFSAFEDKQPGFSKRFLADMQSVITFASSPDDGAWRN